MPSSVSAWVKDRSLEKIDQIHSDLLDTYRDDFNKYSSRIKAKRISEVIQKIPQMLGHRFVNTKINPDLQASSVKKMMELLEKARLAHFVRSCAANGIPLSAEVKDKYLKMIFVDVGLTSSALGLSLTQLSSPIDFLLVNQGGIAEQVTGQLLRCIFPFYIRPELYYWRRDEKGSSAEIDFVIQHKNQVVPLEVKSGKTGSLKSLHLFMELRKLPIAIRVNADLPSVTRVDVQSSLGVNVQYKLLSLPFYMTGQIHRLLEKLF